MSQLQSYQLDSHELLLGDANHISKQLHTLPVYPFIQCIVSNLLIVILGHSTWIFLKLASSGFLFSRITAQMSQKPEYNV